ncbi:hypothetical protein U9M48_018876 [Paspalum notatum var. saurae]|uniref:Integrase catalytic domain-containing protein n=1 Tax=Paspalum notatum var. saurae TaxID=547442 RepID=A0AAQ3TCU5_PASNO
MPSFNDARNMLVLKELRLTNEVKVAQANALLAAGTGSATSTGNACFGGCGAPSALTTSSILDPPPDASLNNSGSGSGGGGRSKARARVASLAGSSSSSSRPDSSSRDLAPLARGSVSARGAPLLPGALLQATTHRLTLRSPVPMSLHHHITGHRLLRPLPGMAAAPADPIVGSGWTGGCSPLQGSSPSVLDTGATSHMTSSDGILLFSSPPLHPLVTMGNGNTIPVTTQGHAILPTQHSNFHLNNILVDLSLVRNLLSIRHFTRDNLVSIEFDPAGFSIKDLQTRHEILRCASDGDLYTFPAAAASNAHTHLVVSPTVWHQRLGHPAPAVLASFQQFGADNGGEFVNNTMHAFLASRGILLRLSCPYTSSQNGKAERIIHTLNNSVRTLLLQASMHSPYWAEALATSTYLLNRRPSSAIHGRTPYSILYGTNSDLDHLRVFGCLAILICLRRLHTSLPPAPLLASFSDSFSLDFLVEFEDPLAPYARPFAAAPSSMDVERPHPPQKLCPL